MNERVAVSRAKGRNVVGQCFVVTSRGIYLLQLDQGWHSMFKKTLFRSTICLELGGSISVFWHPGPGDHLRGARGSRRQRGAEVGAVGARLRAGRQGAPRALGRHPAVREGLLQRHLALPHGRLQTPQGGPQVCRFGQRPRATELPQRPLQGTIHKLRPPNFRDSYAPCLC